MTKAEKQSIHQFNPTLLAIRSFLETHQEFYAIEWQQGLYNFGHIHLFHTKEEWEHHLHTDVKSHQLESLLYKYASDLLTLYGTLKVVTLTREFVHVSNYLPGYDDYLEN